MLYLGRALRTKETLPDFYEWRRVTRRPLVFRGLTGSQRTPRNWDVTPGFIRTLNFIAQPFKNSGKSGLAHWDQPMGQFGLSY